MAFEELSLKNLKKIMIKQLQARKAVADLKEFTKKQVLESTSDSPLINVIREELSRQGYYLNPDENTHTTSRPYTPLGKMMQSEEAFPLTNLTNSPLEKMIWEEFKRGRFLPDVEDDPQGKFGPGYYEFIKDLLGSPEFSS
ncbi:MAG: hypothetical protein Q6354_03955 [Candidatus Brocadiales bacterium]|nr:hypothetical protein [Candidatus Brocadiales bacterium]